MSRIKHIFWDNDGILVDTEHLYFQATRETLASIDIELGEDDYRELLLNQARGAWFMAEERGHDENTIKELVNKRNIRYGELITQHDVFIDGSEEVVASLHGLVPMGIVTSSRGDHFELIHKDAAITQYMEFILWSGMYERSKPHPDPYLKALEVSQVDPSEVLVIEDSKRGLQAAKEAGLQCWVIPTGLTLNQDFSAAERVLDNIAELPNLLKPLL